MGMSIREKGKERRRERILAAARRLIAQGGLEMLSTRRLAEEAELSVHTLYKLVGNRDEIINAVMEENQRRVSSSLRAPGHSYGLSSIFAFVDTTYDILADDPVSQKPLMKALMQLYEAGLASPRIDQMMQQEFEWFVLSVKAARRQGLLESVPGVDAFASSLMRVFVAGLREYLFDRIGLEHFRLQTHMDFNLLLAAVSADTARAAYLQEAARLGRKMGKLAPMTRAAGS